MHTSSVFQPHLARCKDGAWWVRLPIDVHSHGAHRHCLDIIGVSQEEVLPATMAKGSNYGLTVVGHMKDLQAGNGQEGTESPTSTAVACHSRMSGKSAGTRTLPLGLPLAVVLL